MTTGSRPGHPLDALGTFWLADNPAEKRPGVLAYDTRTGGHLRVLGAFDGLDPLTGGSADAQRILGEAGGRYYTLENCFQRRRGYGDGAEQTMHVGFVLTDAHFAAGEPLTFLSAACELAGLGEWIGRSGLTQERVTTDAGATSYTIRAERLPEMSITATGGNLQIAHWYGAEMASGRRAVREGFRVQVNRTEPTPHHELHELISDFQDLVSIGTHRTASFHELVLSGFEGETGSAPIPVRMLAEWSAEPREYKDPVHETTAAFMFTDIGGMDGVGRWMEVATQHRFELGHVVGTRYRPGVLVGDKLLNRAAALERLHRVDSGEKNRDFSKRLQSLAGLAGEQFGQAVGDVDGWAAAVTRARNEAAHQFGRFTPGGSTLHYIAESAYWLFVLALMRKAGFPPAAFDRVASCPAFVHDFQLLRGALTP